MQASSAPCAFVGYYRTTILAEETDPDKLHDLQADLDGVRVYTTDQVDEFVKRYLVGADRDQLDPILKDCVTTYIQDLDEDGQVAFKGNAKALVWTYAFLPCILPYTSAAWEKRSIFLTFLIPKLPAPKEEACPRASLTPPTWTATGSRSGRCRRSFCRRKDAEIDPVPTSGGGQRPQHLHHCCFPFFKSIARREGAEAREHDSAGAQREIHPVREMR